MPQYNVNTVRMRIWGMYQLPDRSGYRNARMGGFASEASAVRAIARKGGIGYIMTQNRVVINAVRNGKIVSLG
jgi:hypothetical protein